MINQLLKSDAINCPWPVMLADGDEIEGRMGINSICRTKCQTRRCSTERSSLIGTRCHLGLTVYEGRVDTQVVRVFGVVGPQHRDDLPRHPEFKHACKGRSVTAQEFATWVSSLKELSTSLQSWHHRRLAEALEPLHDAMRLARDVGQLAEQVLTESTPDVPDRFAMASPACRSMVKTSSLLVDTFDLLEIYLNPNAAAFGQKRSVEIYRLIDKLARIASLARAQERRPPVKLLGSTRRAYDVYESFKLLPFVLIDNAQKYSRQGGSVEVSLIETGSSLEISVVSDGALLTPEEQQLIFERGYRGIAARAAHPGGMGLGLYIAKTIAQVHGSSIRVTSTPGNFAIGGIPQARNVFSFLLKG